MYSVIELAKMYGVTRQTMNNKVNSEEMKPYIINDNGKKIIPEGLNMLNVMMANGHVKQNLQENDIDFYKAITTEKDKHIELLQKQVEELKLDKERLYNELKEQRQTFLLSAPKDNQEIKKSFFKKIFM